MESSRVCWIVLYLFAFTAQAVVTGSSAATDDDEAASVSLPAVQYLQQLFQRFKESNRAVEDGEINLLPDETKGFANTVYCFRAQTLPQDAPDEMRLQFDLSSLGPAQKILATQFVLMVPEMNFNRNLRVYEVSQNGEVVGPLSSKMTLASMAKPGMAWMEFTIRYVTEYSGATSHGNFIVKVTDERETERPSNDNMHSLLDTIMPHLVVYAHDNTPNRPPTVGNQEEGLGVQKREATSTSPLPTLSELENEPCQKYSPFLTYEQLGWPSSVVISPPGGLHFTYCYGHCNSFLSSEIEYARHSQLLQAINTYQTQKNLPTIPPPCCVALNNYGLLNMITAETNGYKLWMIQVVNSCGCM